jgi:hypothetical protein
VYGTVVQCTYLEGDDVVIELNVQFGQVLGQVSPVLVHQVDVPTHDLCST